MELMILQLIIGALVFFAGTCIFSFLNVIIYRVPRKMSFVKGFSMCPECGRRLGAKDLVPVFSYLFLKGKCRYCGAHIGIRDTLIEVFGGLAALFCCHTYLIEGSGKLWFGNLKFDNLGVALTVFGFYCVLTVVAFLDIDTMEIEDGCHLAVLVLTVAAVFTMPDVSIPARLIGAVCVSLPMLLLTLAVPGAFGGGDIKLMAACGLFLGWKLTLVSAVLAVLTGGIYGIWLLAAKKMDRKAHFAFGPFLCIGMAVAVPYGMQLLDWYTKAML